MVQDFTFFFFFANIAASCQQKKNQSTQNQMKQKHLNEVQGHFTLQAIFKHFFNKCTPTETHIQHIK